MSANETADRELAGHSWRAAEIATMLLISARAFKQMRALGAVDAAHGTGKSARYGETHVAQARRVLELMGAEGLSMPVAAELLRSNNDPALPSKTSKRGRAIDACIFGRVEDFGSGVFLVHDPRNHSKLQRQLLVELRRCVAIDQGIRNLHRQKGARVFSSRIHRAR